MCWEILADVILLIALVSGLELVALESLIALCLNVN
jgi:hypothetical protein